MLPLRLPTWLRAVIPFLSLMLAGPRLARLIKLAFALITASSATAAVAAPALRLLLLLLRLSAPAWLRIVRLPRIRIDVLAVAIAEIYRLSN